MKLLNLRKIWIVIGVVIAAIILIASFFYVTAEMEWPDEVPTGAILITLEDISTGEQWFTAIDIEPPSLLETMFGRDPVTFTQLQADVKAVDPNAVYTLTFDLDYIVSNAADMRFMIRGTVPDIWWTEIMGSQIKVVYWNDMYQRVPEEDLQWNQFFDIETSVPTGNNQQSFLFDSVGQLEPYPGSNEGVIFGKYLDTSEFTLRILASGYNETGFYSTGMVRLDITLNVLPTGEITITVNDIQVEVTEV